MVRILIGVTGSVATIKLGEIVDSLSGIAALNEIPLEVKAVELNASVIRDYR